MNNIILFAASVIHVNGGSYTTGLPTVAGNGTSNVSLNTILSIVFGIAAAIAVLFVAIGGMRYVFSDGDPQKAATAKNTIIYAVVGLLVSITAEAIVAFALNTAS